VLADPKIWHLPLTLLVVLTTLSHYRVRCDMLAMPKEFMPSAGYHTRCRPIGGKNAIFSIMKAPKTLATAGTHCLKQTCMVLVVNCRILAGGTQNSKT